MRGVTCFCVFYLCLLFFPYNFSYTQENNYETIWKEIELFQQKGNYQSAIILIDSLNKDGDLPIAQRIKAFIYRLKLQEPQQENHFLQALYQIDTFSQSHLEPIPQLMASIRGQIMWNFFQANRHRFYQRTFARSTQLDDPTLWDWKTMMQQIAICYTKSVENPPLLQQIALPEYAELLVYPEDENWKTAPTLFDFLAHRAINYFQNPEIINWLPSEQMVIQDVRFFASTSDFCSLAIPDIEDPSTWKAAQIMQQLELFHAQQKDTNALVRNELKRLALAYQLANEFVQDGATKYDLYKNALLNLQKKYPIHPIVGEVNVELAKFYIQQQRDDIPENFLLLAHELCRETIDKFPQTPGAKQSEDIKNKLEIKQISGSIERYHSADKAMLALVKFQNIESFYLSVYREKTNSQYESVEKRHKKAQLIYEKQIVLPPANDLRQHHTEIALDPLPIGEYIIVYSLNKTFDKADNYTYFEVQVSNLTYSIRSLGGNQSGIWITDRDTGKAVHGAEISLIKKDKKKHLITITDMNGWAQVEHQKNEYDQQIEINYQNDRLKTHLGLYYEDTVKSSHRFDYLFFDRAIYRPGQTLYFKGIRLKRTAQTSEIIPHERVKITLTNAHGKEVANLYLTSNEYGSFSGSFSLPTHTLTGQMFVFSEYGSGYFSVEEYKRPTFKAELLNSTMLYKLGDTIAIEGQAYGYAGQVIDQAQVNYVVKRSKIHLRQPFMPPVHAADVVVTKGVLTSDKNGRFSFSFPALPDPLDAQYRSYVYTLQVDVSDRSGETQSASKQLIIGHDDRQLWVQCDSVFDRSQSNKVHVSVLNAQQQAVHGKGKIEVYSLENQQKITRNRSWSAPDLPMISEEEFAEKFPHFDYQPYKQKIINIVEQLQFDTAQDSLVFLQTDKYPEGEYRIQTTLLTENGEEITDIRTVKVVDISSKKTVLKDVLTVYVAKTTYEVGDTVVLVLSSATSDQDILFEVGLHDQIVDSEHLHLSDERRHLAIVVEPKHRGGFSCHFFAVKYGLPYSVNLHFTVPYSESDLQVYFETFRDKISPGEQETWHLRFSGTKQDKITAEVLLTMYDASLDAFAKNRYFFSPFIDNTQVGGRYSPFSGLSYGQNHAIYPSISPNFSAEVPELRDFGYQFLSGKIFNVLHERTARMSVASGTRTQSFSMVAEEALQADASLNDGAMNEHRQTNEWLAVRTNFDETAFFYPHLQTDSKGNLKVQFTAPESLTKWRVLGLAHTKKLAFTLFENELVTQKNMMIQLLAPRFLRVGDELILRAKVSNLTDSRSVGKATIELIDAKTQQAIALEARVTEQIFDVDAQQSEIVSWKITVPQTCDLLLVRVRVLSGKHSDGEEHLIPILSDKILLTETLPITASKVGEQAWTLDNLLQPSASQSSYSLTFEYAQNPLAYVLQSLPTLMEGKSEQAEQLIARFYAYSLATYLLEKKPQLKQMIAKWSAYSPEFLVSNLDKNQELKAVLLEETPWVLETESEHERKKRLSSLLDLANMTHEQTRTIEQLRTLQHAEGALMWHKGMPANWAMTDYFVRSIGHLQTLGVLNLEQEPMLKDMIERSISFLDKNFSEYRQKYGRQEGDTSTVFTHFDASYFYTRSFFRSEQATISHLIARLKKDGKYTSEHALLSLSLTDQVMLSLAMHRFGERDIARDIMHSVLQRSIYSDEFGLYWKDDSNFYHFGSDPIARQALIIEALSEVLEDSTSIDRAKTWLLTQKRTTSWSNTINTALACYALLSGEIRDQKDQNSVKIYIGKKQISVNDRDELQYIKKRWDSGDILSQMAHVRVIKTDDQTSWGALYWQYFKSIDNIASSGGGLSLQKKLFVVRQTMSGEELVPLEENLSVGDKIRVRLVLVADRDFDFVHMKDYRASCLEPTVVFSRVCWQDGLSYYENTRDLASHFFFDHLPKGSYVFEYDLWVRQSGNFSAGLAQVECMYAPEYQAHTQTGRIYVEY